MPKQDVDADWDRRAILAAIQACKDTVSPDGIPPRATLTSLNDSEWGWLVSAAVFAWIATKSTQAVAEGLAYDDAIFTMHKQEIGPVRAGILHSIFPSLGQLSLPWNVAIGNWPKGQMMKLCHYICEMVKDATEAHAIGKKDTIFRKLNPEVMAREASAAAGGPLLSPGELGSDDLPF